MQIHVTAFQSLEKTVLEGRGASGWVESSPTLIPIIFFCSKVHKDLITKTNKQAGPAKKQQ